MLDLDRVTVRYGTTLALDDVSVQLPDDTILAVLGPSGCGKSTLLRVIAGLEPAATGRVLEDGRDITRLPTHKRGFALMFQDGQLFPQQSVAQNVSYALRLRRTPREELRRRVGELLDLVGLTGYADRLPATLSGGERQRVALARALAVEPKLLLLDEPLSALDASLRLRLAADLREILKSAGTSALMVTHDQEEAFAVADRIAVMRAGRIVQEGTPHEVWSSPVDADTALFLGYARVLRDEAAERVTAAAGVAPASAVAVRRSAFQVVAHDADFEGVVRTSQATPEQWRLTVEVSKLGTIDAVARLGAAGDAVPEPGQRVRLRVDVARIASLSI
ncbi:MAG: ABC transporter ATP-binding protein [Nocardioides sp.]|jgi:thiamine transport system ATP-binding protein